MVEAFRRQCLDHAIVLNERHLLRLLTESSSTTTLGGRTAHWRWQRLSHGRERSSRRLAEGSSLAPCSAACTTNLLGGCLVDYWGPTAPRLENRMCGGCALGIGSF
jgi:hypothetical protein